MEDAPASRFDRAPRPGHARDSHPGGEPERSGSPSGLLGGGRDQGRERLGSKLRWGYLAAAAAFKRAWASRDLPPVPLGLSCACGEAPLSPPDLPVRLPVHPLLPAQNAPPLLARAGFPPASTSPVGSPLGLGLPGSQQHFESPH